MLHSLKQSYPKNQKAILLFSGGLDTTFLTYYFSHELNWDITTLSFNIGGYLSNSDKLKALSRKAGSRTTLVLDVRDAFVTNYVTYAIFANAKYMHTHPLSSSLSRPLMMKEAVKYASDNKISYIIHGSNEYQNNWARFNGAHYFLESNILCISPIRDCSITRKEMMHYLQTKKITVRNHLYSSDSNLWGYEVEDDKLQDLWWEKEGEMFRFTNISNKTPTDIILKFYQGLPVALDGKTMDLIDIITTLTTLGLKYQFGIYDSMESRTIGIKEREVHFSPAASLIIRAHEDLENTILPEKDLLKKRIQDLKWSTLVCHGLWFSPMKAQLDRENVNFNKKVNGIVRIKLFPGAFRIEGRKVKSVKRLYKNKNPIQTHIRNIQNITKAS